MSEEQANFENNIDRLQKIVEQLESGELDLEKGVALYREGLGLAASCRRQLDEARLAVSQVAPGGLEPFDAGSGEEN